MLIVKNQIEQFEIIELIEKDNETKVKDKNGKIITLPYLLKGYPNSIKLCKKEGDKEHIVYSLLQQKDSPYFLNNRYPFKIKSQYFSESNGRQKIFWELSGQQNETHKVLISYADLYNYKIGDEITCLVSLITPKRLFLKFEPNRKSNLIQGLRYKLILEDVKPFSKDRPELSILILKDNSEFYHTAIGHAWQNIHKDLIKEIYCTPDQKGSLTQSFINISHPVLTTGQSYEFTFITELENRPNKILVLGVDNAVYVVNRPFVFYNKTIPDNAKIKLTITGNFEKNGYISAKYFITFEDIIKNFRALKRITFDNFRKEAGTNNTDSRLHKMIRDFDNFENLWVMSFCEVLREKIDHALTSQDFETALIFMDVLLLVEKWIVNSGFLSSFASHKGELISIEAIKEIDLLTKQSKALELILDNNDGNLPEKFKVEIDKGQFSYEVVSSIYVQLYISKYKNDLHDLKKDDFLNFVMLLGKKDFFLNEKNAAGIVLDILEDLRIEYEQHLFSKVFINSEKRQKYYSKNTELLSYISITYLSLIISRDIDNVSRVFYLFLRFLKLTSLYESEPNRQLSIVTSAILKSSNESSEIADSISPHLTWDQLTTSPETFINSSSSQKTKPFRNIEDITISLSNNSFLKVRVTGNTCLGYTVAFKEDILFLPFFNAHRPLKKGEQIDVIVYKIDSDFHHALVKTSITLGSNHCSQEIEIGSIVTGVVKNIEEYGVFMNLGSHDALMPKKEISTQYIVNAEDVLDIGDTIKAKVLSKEQNGELVRITVSRKEILKENAKKPLSKGVRYEARITNIDEFYGIFVELTTGHVGLIRKEEVSWSEFEYINDLYNRGDKIQVIFLYGGEDKNFFSLKLCSADPFLIKNIEGKTYTSKIIGFVGLETWLNKYGIEEKPVTDLKNNTLISFCPFCYRKSAFSFRNKRMLTDERTLIVTNERRSWECTLCKERDEESITLYLPEIHSLASFGISTLSKKEYNRIRSVISKKDFVDVRIIKVNRKERTFELQINFESFQKGYLKTEISPLDKFNAYEIAGLYEHYAFLLDDFKKRISYLGWARYYYGVSRSAKSYYLTAYISYINLINKITYDDKLNSDFDSIQSEINLLITEIEIQSDSLTLFPVIEKIITLLKVLRTFRNISSEASEFLLAVSLSDSENGHEYVNNLAASVLSYNLLEKDSNLTIIENLKERIVLLLKRSLSSFSDSEVDTEIFNKRLLIDKLLQKGEDNNCEFKASLDVPVLNKDSKILIATEVKKLEKMSDANEIIKVKNKIKDLENVNIFDKKLIGVVNLSFIKTIAAFANSNGGYLLIGVDEDEHGTPYVLGLEADMTKHKNKDGIILRFDNIVQNYIGNAYASEIFSSVEIILYKGKELLFIEVKKSRQPVFVTTSEEKKFYVRRQASTVALSPFELFEYFQTNSRQTPLLQN